jgi:hypothetical protein
MSRADFFAESFTGTIWSSSPCRTRVGTSNFFKSSVWSVAENALMLSKALFEARLYALQRELIERPLGDIRSRPVGAIKWYRQHFVELRAVLQKSSPQLVELVREEALQTNNSRHQRGPIGTAFARRHAMTSATLRTLLLAPAITGLLAVSCPAGHGRQTLIVEADYGYESVCRWIEQNADAIQKNSGVKILQTVGSVVTLQIETKYGTEVFRIRRSGARGDYRASFVDRSAGTLTNYSYRFLVTSLEGGRSQVEVTMTAFSEDHNGVSVNIELRKSLRMMRTFLEHSLTKEPN